MAFHRALIIVLVAGGAVTWAFTDAHDTERLRHQFTGVGDYAEAILLCWNATVVGWVKRPGVGLYQIL